MLGVGLGFVLVFEVRVRVRVVRVHEGHLGREESGAPPAEGGVAVAQHLES